MKKINPKEFASFILKRPGFSYCGSSWRDISQAFEKWNCSCTLIGVRPDGSRKIITSK